jgi:flagellar protein FliS
MDAKTHYREASVRGASPVRLVLCLYEQAIEDLRRAVLAMENGKIAVRTCHINHALLVIAQLEGTLDMERGGEVARNLEKFYGVVRRGLIEAQQKQSTPILEQQITQLSTVHEAWLEVERATDTGTRSGDPSQARPSISSPSSISADWSA